MRHHWQKDYPTVPSLTEEELDENSSLKKMLRLVGGGKRVIDFGCATGYLARLLRARGCEVVGVEINEKAAKIAEEFCERVIVADLDYVTLTELLPDQKFDVAVFGDVLEHLRNPWELLEEVRQILTDDGYVVASIPNVGHGAVRLALLKGQFQYEQLGLLDSTHLRFFTRQSVIDLFEQSGYTVELIDPTLMPVFSGLWIPKVDKEDFAPEVVQTIEQEEDADTFQFVLRAFPLTQDGRYLALESKHARLLDECEQFRVENKRLKLELATQHTERQAEVEQLTAQVQQTHQEAYAHWQHSQQELAQTQQELARTQQTLTETEIRLQNVKTEFEQHVAFTASQLNELSYQLDQSNLRLLQLENDLIETQQDQEVQRFRAERFQHKLQEVREKLQEVREKFQRSKTNLANTRKELEDTHNELVAMKTSKFWKLRSGWVGIRKRLGIKGD